MKKNTVDLLRKYAKMSGDKKIRLAIKLSEMVRRVRQDGKIATGS